MNSPAAAGQRFIAHVLYELGASAGACVNNLSCHFATTHNVTFGPQRSVFVVGDQLRRHTLPEAGRTGSVGLLKSTCYQSSTLVKQCGLRLVFKSAITEPRISPSTRLWRGPYFCSCFWLECLRDGVGLCYTEDYLEVLDASVCQQMRVLQRFGSDG